MFPYQLWRPYCAILGFLLFALTGGRMAAAGGPLDMRIEMYGVGDLHVATNRTTEDESANRYTITTDVESRAIASLFVDVKSHSEVHGRLIDNSVYPDAYVGVVLRNGTESYNRVTYAADGTVSGVTRPSPVTPVAVTPALMRGTIDQLSAFFRVERQLAHLGACGNVIAVFDGRRRYDLHFSDGPSQVLVGTGRSSFSGPTQVCFMRRVAIAGFSDVIGRSEGAYEGTLWYAQLLPGELVVPVQMEFGTEFGTILGHLAELHGRGTDLHFSE